MSVSARIFATASLVAVSADDILREIAAQVYFHYGRHRQAEVDTIRAGVRAESDDVTQFIAHRFFCPGSRRCAVSIRRIADRNAVTRLVMQASEEVTAGRERVRERIAPLLARIIEVIEVEVSSIRTDICGYCSELCLSGEIIHYLTERSEGCYADDRDWYAVDERWGVMPLGASRSRG